MASYTHYGCASRLNRGTCSNNLRVAREKVETLLLAGIKRDLITPEAFSLFVKETTRLLVEQQRAQKPAETASRQRLEEVEQEIGNVMVAIKAGVTTKTTKVELERLEDERDRLTERIKEDFKPTGQLVTLLPDALGRYQNLVDKLERLPEQYVDAAREQIKQLVGDRINLVQSEEEECLVAELQGNYAGLLKLAANSAESKGKYFGCGGRI